MKKTFPLLFAAACGFPLMAPFHAAAQAANEPVPAVIVIRHGEDLDNFISAADTNNAGLSQWKSNWAPSWPNYTLPNGGGVTVRSHGLSPLGEKQGAWLATNLPALLQNHNFLPITRVVTKDPYTLNEKGKDPTPNPFETAWPFIKTHGIKDVMLIKAEKGTNRFGPRAGKKNETVDLGLLEMLPCYHGTNNPTNNNEKPSDSILPTNAVGEATGSTLIVWDGQGMWGPHDGPWYWADDTEQKSANPTKVVGANILRLLGGTLIGNELLNRWPTLEGGLPGKAKRLYLFYPRFGTGPFWAKKSPTANNAHVALYGENVPEYDLMVWDIPTDNNGPTGWKNVINIAVDEANGREEIYNE